MLPTLASTGHLTINSKKTDRFTTSAKKGFLQKEGIALAKLKTVERVVKEICWRDLQHPWFKLMSRVWISRIAKRNFNRNNSIRRSLQRKS